MPGLFALAQHPAVQATQAVEAYFAYLDDMYILSRPGRARVIFDVLQAHLQASHALLCGAAVQAYVRRRRALTARSRVSDLLADARWANGPAPSRLPA